MSSSGYSKDLGKKAELLVQTSYIGQGYTHIASNWTIVGGELDLIFQDWKNNLVIVEVKCVDHTQDLFGYITSKKLRILKKTIEYYCNQTQIEYHDVRLDVVFVSGSKIQEVFENIVF